jgi:hypothetical protein
MFAIGGRAALQSFPFFGEWGGDECILWLSFAQQKGPSKLCLKSLCSQMNLSQSAAAEVK